jgi:TPR repeat protein/ankyrin repeat protein
MTKVKILFTIIFMSLIALPTFAEKPSKASIALDAGDYETAIKEYKIKADKGHIDSQFMLGLIYEQYVGPDYIEALKWYKLAAEQGDKESQYIVGKYFEEGKKIPQDFSKSVKWYKKSADQGYEYAQFYLGTMYLLEQGVEYDAKAAFNLFRLSGLKGIALAQFFLGEMYSDGEGVLINKKRALQWYRLAFENGVKDAKIYIDELLSDGYEAPRLCVEVCLKSFWDISNSENRLEKIKSLDISQRSETGESILHTAALFASSKELEVILDLGVDVNVRSNDGRSALHTAVMSDNTESIKLLLKFGANPNARTIWGLTPLGYSDASGFKILKEYGADINVQDANGYSRLHASIDQTSKVKAGYWNSGITFRKYKKNNFLQFIKSGIDLNAKTDEGKTALHLLIDTETINVEAINILISNGADLSLTDADGNTPLYLAAKLKNEAAPELVKALLLAGADPNSTNERKKTPWDVAKKK